MRLFFFVLIIATLCSSATFAAERLKLHLAFGSRTPLYGSLAERLAAEVGQRSARKLRLQLNEPGALVPRFAYLDAVAQGAVDAAWGTPAVIAGRAPEAALFTGVPFGLGPAAHLAWVRDGAGRPLYDALYARFGVVGIPCAAVGPDGLAWLKRPLDEHAPFRGLRVRAFGLPARILDAAGAATALGFGADLVVGLATGAFDAAEGGVPAADVAFGLHTVSGFYLYPSPLQPATLLDVVVNRARWEKLGEPERRILIASCRAVADFAEGAGREADAAALRAAQAAEVVVDRPSSATERILRAAWHRVRDGQGEASDAFREVLRLYPSAD